MNQDQSGSGFLGQAKWSILFFLGLMAATSCGCRSRTSADFSTARLAASNSARRRESLPRRRAREAMPLPRPPLRGRNIQRPRVSSPMRSANKNHGVLSSVAKIQSYVPLLSQATALFGSSKTAALNPRLDNESLRTRSRLDSTTSSEDTNAILIS